MLAIVVVGIGVGGVEGVVVQADPGVGIVGVLGGVVEGDRVGPAGTLAVLEGPVVAVGAEGHDRAGRVEFAHVPGQGFLEPVLGRRRAGVAGPPVLVIGHQDDGVGDAPKSRQGPGVVGKGRRDPDLAADRFERRARLGDEGGIARQGLPRQVFQVEDIAGVAMPAGEDDEVGDQGRTGGGVDQQIAGQGAVGNVVMAVVDHGQDRGRGLGGGDQRLGLGIGGHRDPPQRAVEQDPLGRDHVQLIDMPVERHARALVPADVEAHRQGPRPPAGRGLARPGDAPPPRGPFQPMRAFHMQRLQHLGVLQGQVGQARGEGEGGEEGGDDEGGQGDQQADAQVGAPGAPPRRIVKHEIGHGRTWLVSLRFASQAADAANMTKGRRNGKGRRGPLRARSDARTDRRLAEGPPRRGPGRGHIGGQRRVRHERPDHAASDGLLVGLDGARHDPGNRRGAADRAQGLVRSPNLVGLGSHRRLHHGSDDGRRGDGRGRRQAPAVRSAPASRCISRHSGHHRRHDGPGLPGPAPRNGGDPCRRRRGPAAEVPRTPAAETRGRGGLGGGGAGPLSAPAYLRWART